MAKTKLCRWNCGRKTDRRCGICLFCCNERDGLIASGAPYIPPSERPGHRFYKGDKQRSPKQKAALTSLNQSRMAESAKQTPAVGGIS
jgi:hypothetical protein